MHTQMCGQTKVKLCEATYQKFHSQFHKNYQRGTGIFVVLIYHHILGDQRTRLSFWFCEDNGQHERITVETILNVIETTWKKYKKNNWTKFEWRKGGHKHCWCHRARANTGSFTCLFLSSPFSSKFSVWAVYFRFSGHFSQNLCYLNEDCLNHACGYFFQVNTVKDDGKDWFGKSRVQSHLPLI